MSTASQNREYPVCLDLAKLPPTHNHVIGAVQAISLDNIRGVLAIVHRLLQDNNRNEVAFGEDEINGLSCIIENASHALRFEQYFRRRPEDDAKKAGK